MVPVLRSGSPKARGAVGERPKKKVVHGDATLVMKKIYSKLMTKKFTVKTFRTWDLPTRRLGSASLLGI